MSRPYLIVPQLIEQPTWGGDYIPKLKGWSGNKLQRSKKIGQSHELSSTSQLAVLINTSDDLQPVIKTPDDQRFIPISQIEPVYLLIKLNQAFGNSFQLHVKPETQGVMWMPKPESWYFLEDGFITLGISKDADLGQYKNTCVEIETYINILSDQIKNNIISLKDARLRAYNFAQEKNPWRFVNRHCVRKYDLIDLSSGGIHHSWEENKKDYPNGTVVFEVQLEVSDDDATIRVFDQGKIKDDGSVRKLNIDDYFEHLDNNPTSNTISSLLRIRNKESLLKTPYYAVDILEIYNNNMQFEGTGSYQHLYVRDGAVRVTGNNTTIIVKRGYSCFIPSSLREYTIQQEEKNSVVLKTYPVNS